MTERPYARTLFRLSRSSLCQPARKHYWRADPLSGYIALVRERVKERAIFRIIMRKIDRSNILLYAGHRHHGCKSEQTITITASSTNTIKIMTSSKWRPPTPNVSSLKHTKTLQKNTRNKEGQVATINKAMAWWSFHHRINMRAYFFMGLQWRLVDICVFPWGNFLSQSIRFVGGHYLEMKDNDLIGIDFL